MNADSLRKACMSKTLVDCRCQVAEFKRSSEKWRNHVKSAEAVQKDFADLIADPKPENSMPAPVAEDEAAAPVDGSQPPKKRKKSAAIKDVIPGLIEDSTPAEIADDSTKAETKKKKKKSKNKEGSQPQGEEFAQREEASAPAEKPNNPFKISKKQSKKERKEAKKSAKAGRKAAAQDSAAALDAAVVANDVDSVSEGEISVQSLHFLLFLVFRERLSSWLAELFASAALPAGFLASRKRLQALSNSASEGEIQSA